MLCLSATTEALSTPSTDFEAKDLLLKTFEIQESYKEIEFRLNKTLLINGEEDSQHAFVPFLNECLENGLSECPKIIKNSPWANLHWSLSLRYLPYKVFSQTKLRELALQGTLSFPLTESKLEQAPELTDDQFQEQLENSSILPLRHADKYLYLGSKIDLNQSGSKMQVANFYRRREKIDFLITSEPPLYLSSETSSGSFFYFTVIYDFDFSSDNPFIKKAIIYPGQIIPNPSKLKPAYSKLYLSSSKSLDKTEQSIIQRIDYDYQSHRVEILGLNINETTKEQIAKTLNLEILFYPLQNFEARAP